MKFSLGFLLAFALFSVCWNVAVPKPLADDAAPSAADRSLSSWWKSLKGEDENDGDEGDEDDDDDEKEDWEGYGSFWCWWKNTNGYVMKTEEDFQNRVKKDEEVRQKRLEKFKKWEEGRQKNVVYIPFEDHKHKGNVRNETIDGVNTFYTPWFWLGAGKWWY